MTNAILNLSEELFILSLDERRSAVKFSDVRILPYILVGAQLADLLLLGRLDLDAKKTVFAINPQPCDDEILDETLEQVAKAESPKKLRYWIKTLSEKDKKLRKHLLASLVMKNVLREEKDNPVWVIPYELFPHKNASAKYWIKNRLRDIVLAGEQPNEHSAVLLSLARTCGMLVYIFTPDEVILAGKKVNALVKGEGLDEAMLQKVNLLSTSVVEAAG